MRFETGMAGYQSPESYLCAMPSLPSLYELIMTGDWPTKNVRTLRFQLAFNIGLMSKAEQASSLRKWDSIISCKFLAVASTISPVSNYFTEATVLAPTLSNPIVGISIKAVSSTTMLMSEWRCNVVCVGNAVNVAHFWFVFWSFDEKEPLCFMNRFRFRFWRWSSRFQITLWHPAKKQLCSMILLFLICNNLLIEI